MEALGTILIVDDNPSNLQVLGSILEQGGYKVRRAHSGKIALRDAEKFQPDCIFINAHLSRMNGHEVHTHLQANEKTRDISVVFIISIHDIEDPLNEFSAKGIDRINTPFKAEEVLARARAHVKPPQSIAAPTMVLSQSENQYRMLFENSPIATLIYDLPERKILSINHAFTRLLGYTAELALGQNLDFMVFPGQQTALQEMTKRLSQDASEVSYTDQLQISHQDGRTLEIERVSQRVDFAGNPAQIMTLQDITASFRTREHLQYTATEHLHQLKKSVHYDALTGLPNRALLTERMHQGIEQSDNSDSRMVVCYLDIDDFDTLNALRGRDACDHILINIAECLRSCLRGGDTLARTGGDEFAMLVLGLNSNDEFDCFIENLKTRLAEPFVTDKWTVSISASIGISIYPKDHATPETLLRHAEQTMVAAKQAGRGGCQIFNPETDKKIRAQQKHIELMRAALIRREFILYYQPKVDLDAGTVVGVEALIRWQHPERGLLPPGAFLPEIEESALMLEIDDWVISEALSQMARWRDDGFEISVSVNISAQQLMQKNFILRLRELLAAHPGTGHGLLELEVLETSALEDLLKVELLITECRELGVCFSLDDFGTGYSSLTYLRRLSADTLKIDQSFVKHMLDTPDDRSIVAGVIGLAKAFRRKVIAEGVETLEHGEVLLHMGCKLIQGYGIARPMPAQDLPKWANEWPDATWQEVINHRV